MGHDDHRPRIDVDQPLDHLFAGHVQVVIRLVEQQQVRRPDHQSRQADQLDLAAAQRAQRLVEGLVPQSQVAQGGPDAMLAGQPAGRFVSPQQPLVRVQEVGQAIRVAVDGRVTHLRFAAGQLVAQPRDLGRAGQRGLQHRLRPIHFRVLRQVADGQIFKPENRPTFGGQAAQDQLQQGRFAAPVCADQADLLARLDLPAQLAQDRFVEPGVVDFGQVDDDRGHECLITRKSRRRMRLRLTS